MTIEEERAADILNYVRVAMVSFESYLFDSCMMTDFRVSRESVRGVVVLRFKDTVDWILLSEFVFRIFFEYSRDAKVSVSNVAREIAGYSYLASFSIPNIEKKKNKLRFISR